ncbi:MAG: glycosyltransferase family 2 protein [Chlorobi bacterium]|nr:glycosyltransferase family 2 protein [Chlorobiota bacterium]
MGVLKLLINSIEIVFYVYLGLASLYVFIFALAGLFYKNRKTVSVSEHRRFAVLIPGYKEDAVIVSVAEQATKQDYPDEKYDVIVIADSFSGSTLEKLRKLPIRVEVVEFEVSKKSKALNLCMERIGDDYDVAMILDADNVMGPGVLAKMNMAFERGFTAVQGHRTAKNLNANFAILDALSEEINNHIFRKGHRVLGLSSALIGSGMALEYRLFKSTMATVDSVGEDKEVELKIIRDKHKIEYIHDALIYDEKTSKSDVFVNQRRRWIAAQLDYFRSHFLDGLGQLLTKANVDYFDKVIQMIMPPRIILAGVLFISVIVSALFSFLSIDFISSLFITSYTIWLYIFALTAIGLVISIPVSFYNFKTFLALLKIPHGFLLMLISLFKIKGASKKFLHTTHDHVEETKHN